MNSLNSEQVSQLKDIGTHLQQRRQELSIPIEEVAAKTFIRLPILEALEKGQLDQLPEPVFVQGFIRRYGDVLELDGAALAKSFTITPSSFSPVEPDISSQLPIPRSRSILPFLPYVILVVAAVSGLFYLLSRPKASTPVIRKPNSAVAQQETIVVRPIPDSPAIPTAQSALPIQVTLNFKEQSWLQVTADGKTQFEGILTKGKQQTWTAESKLTLRAGNAGAVSISLNGKEPKLLGALGDVKEVTFTPDS